MARLHQALITCSPGLEQAVRSELRGLHVRRTTFVEPGALAAELSTQQLYAANAFLRCATRVLVNACSFRAISFPHLERAFRHHMVSLEPFLAPGAPVSVKVHARRSALYHEAAIAERIGGWIQRDFPALRKSSASSGAPPEVLLSVFVDRDEFTVRVDSSGDPLHARSWHVDGAGIKMPMRQSVAAGILQAIGWTEAACSAPLVDPFCGSASLPIEAALARLGQPPHEIERSDATAAKRVFALQRWPSFEPGTWGAVYGDAKRREQLAAKRRSSLPPIVAADRDAASLAAARLQARRAGVEDLIDFRCARLSELQPPVAAGDATGGVLVTNPPWGVRSAGGGDLRKLYARLGAVCRDRFVGWTLGVLLEDRKLAREIAPRMETALRLRSGAIRTYLMMARCQR